MQLVTENVASRMLNMADAINAVEEGFGALERGDAEICPVVAGLFGESNRFSVKSGMVKSTSVIGLKIASYWPKNRTSGLPAHASTTMLLDSSTGLPRALLAASHLTALRTAASDGVAIRHLARRDSSVVAIVGSGHQAWFELLAACEERPVRKVLVWNRTPWSAKQFAERVRNELGLSSEARDLETCVTNADIVITVTAASAPLVQRKWVKPGTHISAMGSDARGKYELDPELVAHADLYADVVEQSVTLGDFELALSQGLIDRGRITSIGAVINGVGGRKSTNAITIYDSSGMALQDLVVAELALRRAQEQQLTTWLPLQGTSS